MKQCSKCKEVKGLTEFYGKDRKSSRCKICEKKSKIEFSRTKEGFIRKILRAQKTSCKNRGHNPPEYTLNDLKSFLSRDSVFDTLFNAWTESGYEKDLAPGLDRLNDYKTYSLDNIQVMTWEENRTKGHIDRRNGSNNKVGKPVIQLDINGNIIKEHHSIRSAARELGMWYNSIRVACQSIDSTAGGYKWKFKTKL